MFSPVTSMVSPVVRLRVPATDSVLEMATDPAIEQFREKLGHNLQLVEDSTM
jgi:hypothetical protein